MDLRDVVIDSETLGSIDGRGLQQACDCFDIGQLTAIESPSAGHWGQNILLTTTDGRFVFRGNPTVPSQLRKEAVVANAVHARGLVPVPWPYHVMDDATLFGWSFAIMPLLPGTMGSTYWERSDDDGRVALAAAHGDALAQLHAATFDAPGPYDVELDAFVGVDSFPAWTLERIDALRAGCRDAGALDGEAERYIDGTIDRCRDALAQPFAAVMVHHDFSLANTNYERIDDRFQIAGLFDLGEAHIGDGDEDLVRFLFRRKGPERAAFVAAYHERRPLRAGAADRLAIYALADFLFMWQVSKRFTTGWFRDATFVDAASRVLDTVRAEVSGV